MFYLVDVWSGVEPSLLGPYPTDEERDAAALTHRKDNQSEEDTLFWLDVPSQGEPKIGAYSGAFFGEDETEPPG
jgi:hypothetical protein